MQHSRSSLETYLSSCQFKYFLQYARDNGENEFKGIQLVERSIDLEAGQLAHTIVNQVLSTVMAKPSSELNNEELMSIFTNALQVGLTQYRAIAHLLVDRKIEPDNEELITQSIEEHENLITALCYVWFKTEFQYLIENFQIVTTEKEIETNLVGEHTLLSRVDALLWHKETQEYVTWSLKTTKSMGWFTDAMENSDLQGYLEMIAANNYLKNNRIEVDKFIENIQFFTPSDRAILMKFLGKRFPDGDNVSSVRFCFLVKGDRRASKGSAYPFRSNPLIYGYRKANKPVKPVQAKKGGYTEAEIELASNLVPEFSYAHSFEFYNSENASGIGKLGKDWEKFPVWKEYEGGIIQWIDDIVAGLIQPEAKSPLETFVSAKTITRDQAMLNNTLGYVKTACVEIEEKLRVFNLLSEPDQRFLPNTKSCTIPVYCDFRLVCPYSGVGEIGWIIDPLKENNEGVRLFQIRVPHHPEKLEESKQISLPIWYDVNPEGR